jgi:hypothetical protein
LVVVVVVTCEFTQTDARHFEISQHRAGLSNSILLKWNPHVYRKRCHCFNMWKTGNYSTRHMTPYHRSRSTLLKFWKFLKLCKRVEYSVRAWYQGSHGQLVHLQFDYRMVRKVLYLYIAVATFVGSDWCSQPSRKSPVYEQDLIYSDQYFCRNCLLSLILCMVLKTAAADLIIWRNWCHISFRWRT